MATGQRSTTQKRGEPTKTDRTAALSRIIRIAAATTEFEALSRSLARELASVLPVERCTCAALTSDPANYRLELLLETRPGPPGSLYAVFPVGDDVLGLAIREGKPQLITDPSSMSDRLPSATDPLMWDGGFATILCLPLQVGGRVLGAIILGTGNRMHTARKTSNSSQTSPSTSPSLSFAGRSATSCEDAREDLGHLGTFPELNPAAIIELDSLGLVYYMNPAADQRLPGVAQHSLPIPHSAGPALLCGGDAE